MSNQSRQSMLGDHKTAIIIIAMALFLIELEIVAVFSARSGKQALVQVVDQGGHVIYETDDGRLSRSDKQYIEKTFGPLAQYHTRLDTRQAPFPFRAWLAAAAGIPVGAMLLFGFIFKACMVLFHGERKLSEPSRENPSEQGTWLEKTLVRISRLNIFIIGFLVFLSVLAYWVVPNLIGWVGQAGMEMLSRYGWVVLSMGCVATAIIVWMIYLRYLLAKKTIEQRGQVEQLRLHLEFKHPGQAMARLGYDSDRSKGIGQELKIKQ